MMDEDDIQNEQALLFMDAWGDGSKLVESPFLGFKYAIEGYHPEYSSEMLGYYFEVNNDLVVTVLANSLATVTPADLEGYRAVHSFPAGERDCPGGQYDNHGADCPICQGDNYVYWGEEWVVYVLVPILIPTREVLDDGTIEYRLEEGSLHRDDGPARLYSNGREEWFQFNRLHRDDGPAIVDTIEYYYLEDHFYEGPEYIKALMKEYPSTIPTWDEASRIILEKNMQGGLRGAFEKAVHDRVSQPRPTLWDHLEEAV